VFQHFKPFVLIISLVISSVFLVTGQDKITTEKKPQEKTVKPAKPAKEEKTDNKQSKTLPSGETTPEQVAESSIVIYSGFRGREGLKQVRKTAIERGKISITNADGTIDQANYEKRILRGDNLDKEKIRFDQEFPTAKFALIYNDNKIIGVFNDSVFTPRDDATKAFQNQIWHGLEALLRYKENEATIALSTKEKYMGVDYFTLDVTDKQSRKTRFFISAKTFRVMWLEYTDDEVKYIRKFSDYRDAQGTLVPYRSVLTANGKVVEETSISTITYGQKVDDGVFQTS
jgi:hypothetical protein